LDDFAGRLFGSPDTVELPPLGERLNQHAVGWTFARDSRSAAVLAPASGTVLAINQTVARHPEIISLDPYHRGWLMILEPVLTRHSLKGLYYGKERDLWMENEVRGLLELLGSPYENLAATGARALDDIFGTCPDLDWDELTLRFLKTERLEKP
jgi:glycine cleavage system H lipoate-binding protein